MSQIEKTIEVGVPISVAYNQWTQFEDFPQFMDDVQEVRQLDEDTLHWRAQIGGHDMEWDAKIIEQDPDRRIAWVSMTGATNAGAVSFMPLGPERTKVTLVIEFDPEGILENVGAVLGVPGAGVENDLINFKKFIEARGKETGAWRGTI